MERNNNINEEIVEPVNRSQLLYATNNKEILSSGAANIPTNMTLYMSNKKPTCNTHEDNNVFNIQLDYNINQARDPDPWNNNFQVISLCGSMKHLASDLQNIKVFLIRMQKYILGKAIESENTNNINDLQDISKVAWSFISSLYEVHWDSLAVDKSNILFRNMVKSKFSPQHIKTMTNDKGKNTIKLVTISLLPPLISAKSPKEVNKILKYFKKKPALQQKKLYAQASSSTNTTNIAKDTLKIKETFSNFKDHKIEQIQKIISNVKKPKPRLNMTTKDPSHKQVIVPMSIENMKYFMRESSMHVININRTLKGIKSNIMADFVHLDNKGIIISTNNVTCLSDLQEIEKYIKNTLCMVTDQIAMPRLPQSKSYLKIISISFVSEFTNSWITSDNVEKILKANHIFNDIVLASKLRVIKVSPKSDMSIVWIDIWDTQNGSKARTIINRRFNVGSFITIVRGANMNSGVLLCKNCWK